MLLVRCIRSTFRLSVDVKCCLMAPSLLCMVMGLDRAVVVIPIYVLLWCSQSPTLHLNCDVQIVLLEVIYLVVIGVVDY